MPLKPPLKTPASPRRTTALRFALFALALLLSPLVAPHSAQAQERGFYLKRDPLLGPCSGQCSWTLMAGKQVTTGISEIFGVADFTQGEWGFFKPIPISEWEWAESYFVGGAMSRRLLTLGHHRFGEVISIEGELGAGKRMGIQTEVEVWGAFYARWHLFPWTKWVKTSVGVSTGLSYTSGISEWERNRSGNDEGSRLLHYLSPELTLAFPDTPDQELVFRFSHRSGGSDMFGPNSIFNNTGGGAQYMLVGMRYKF